MRNASRIIGEVFVGIDLFAIGVAMIWMTWFVQRDLPVAEWTTWTLLTDAACWLVGVIVSARGIRMIRSAVRRPSPVPVARAERRA